MKRVLISVYDKTGLEDVCSKLVLMGYSIVSTGGTKQYLADHGFKVIDVSDITGVGEMLDGRVKTLNNLIYGGILAKRDGTHNQDIEKYNLPLFDIVIVNLYPFEKVINQPGTTLDDAIENIDIGGVSLLRASAKNYKYLWCVSNISQYSRLIMGLGLRMDGLCSNNEDIDIRKEFAIEAFETTTHYDSIISKYLLTTRMNTYNSNNAINSINNANLNKEKDGMPEYLNLKYKKIQSMRYGENSHQIASLYQPIDNCIGNGSNNNGIINAKQLQGKELSYNNIVDADSALQCASFIAKGFPSKYVCVIVKHNNPCGVALGNNYLEVYEKAFKTDPTSAFGGIIAFAFYSANNSNNDKNSIVGIINNDVAKKIIDNQFVEVIIGNAFSTDAIEIFKKKNNVRILECNNIITTDNTNNTDNAGNADNKFEIKSVSGGGILYQTSDTKMITHKDLDIKSKKIPTEDQIDQLLFAWYVAKFVKSNAIVFVKDNMTIGIGAGQMSRIDSTRLAIMKAKNADLDVSGCVVASDAFFPFSDGVEAILDSGAVAIIQPGGSIKDKDVIMACDARDGIMVMTGTRHFRH